MTARILILLLLAPALLPGESLSRGMTQEDVQAALGHAESTMATGPREILIYADGTRLEFVDGKLVKQNNRELSPPPPAPAEKPAAKEPLIKAEEIVEQREGKTIGASVQAPNIGALETGQSYQSGGRLESLEADIAAGALAADGTGNGTGANLLQGIAIAFGIEIAVTLLVLSIAFQISGFPTRSPLPVRSSTRCCAWARSARSVPSPDSSSSFC